MNVYEEARPWGNFRRFTLNEPSTVKIITVRAGESFSLQTHEHREEFWRILSGSPLVTVGEDQVTAAVGQEFFIPRQTKHRIAATDEDASILEIATGDFDEADIVRLQDKYNRP